MEEIVFILYFQKEKVLNILEKKKKAYESEMESIVHFKQHNDTSFVTEIKRRLLSNDANRYRGKEGNQRLQSDIRLIKYSTGGKLPPLGSDLLALVTEGKSKVYNKCDINLDSISTATTDSCNSNYDYQYGYSTYQDPYQYYNPYWIPYSPCNQMPSASTPETPPVAKTFIPLLPPPPPPPQ